jgi:hypothetical protein
MKISRLIVLLLAVLTTLSVPMWQSTAVESAERGLPQRIALPRGWQPEGITTNRTSLFVGSLKDGAIWTGDPLTGRGHVLAKGKQGRAAAGVDYDARRHLLWVAGGGTGVIRAHKARSGRVVATYSFGSGRFLNDITVTRRAVYATDSMTNELAVVPLRRHSDALPPAGRARTLRLTGDLRVVANAFNLNGIVNDHGWLLSVQSVTGQLFRIDPRSGRTRRVDVRGASLVNGDGLEFGGDVLYVVRNQNNKVVALDLNRRLTSAVRLTTLTRSGLDVPTTAAVARHALWTVNARFNTPPTATTRYWITRLPLLTR